MSAGQVASTAGPQGNSLLTVSDRLEIISPHDVSLVKFLGSGGYGEVYLGKWHSSEAAIKCLNASLFYPGGDGSQARPCSCSARPHPGSFSLRLGGRKRPDCLRVHCWGGWGSPGGLLRQRFHRPGCAGWCSPAGFRR